MKEILQKCSLRRLLSLMFLLAMVGNAWGEDETLTISGASSGNNAPWGTSYGDGSGTSTTSAGTSIGISYTQVARMSSAIQIAKNTSSGFYSTTVPSDKVIKSVTITSKTNSVNLHVSTDGTNWTSADAISSTTTRSYTVNQAYKYFKVTATSKYAQITNIVVTYMSDGSDKTAISTPTNVSSSNITDKNAELSWDAVSGASDYTVQYKEHSAENWETVSPNPTSTSYILSGLEYNTEYDYQICANPTNTTTYKSSAFASGTFTTLDFINAAGTYNIVPNNVFWGRSTQDGSQSVTANTAFGPITRYGISVSMNSGTSTNSYMKSDHSRAYAGYTVTIAAPTGFNLTSIVFTGSAWVVPSASVGTMNSKTWTGNANSVTFTFSGTSYMSNIAVTYEVPKVLQSITVSGTPTKTEYEDGESLDPTGLEVTGTYNTGDEVITDGINWTIDPETLTAGATTCDVKASVGSIVSDVYTVTGLTVKSAAKHYVTFNVNGDDSNRCEVYESQSITFPTDITDLYGKKFVGWTAATIDGTQATAPAFVTEASMGTEDITYYAVFASQSGSPAGSTQNASMSVADYASANGWVNDTKYSSMTILSDVLTATAVGNSNTGRYYTVDDTWRLYQTETGTVTVSAATGYTLESVTVTYKNKNTGAMTYGGNQIESGTKVNVTGSSATFGVGNTSTVTNGQVQITQISVEYHTTGNLSYSNYCTTVPEAISATISAAGYATFVPNKNVTVPEDVTAYAVKVEGSVAKLNAVNAIPANTAVVIKGGEGTYYFPVTSESVETISTDLKYSDSNITANGSQYILAKKDGVVGFYKATTGTTIKAGKAYLEMSSNVKSITFEEVTGVNTIANSVDVNAPVYNLRGQRVSAEYKGIVIKNGKKYLNK